MQQIFVFIALILLGFLLRSKIKNPQELAGIKKVILYLALPAVIFIALLKIKLEIQFLWLPVIAIVINLAMYWISKGVLMILEIPKDSSKYRTIMMLFPSFAPGLSCFPFLIEFFEEPTLAGAAFADVGNKIFVLIILYLVAMSWYYQQHPQARTINSNRRIRELLWTMAKEPINIVLVLAIVMLCFGANLASLPLFLQDTVTRLGVIMTPLILLFIGMSVKGNVRQIGGILQILILRSGAAFLISSALLLMLPTSIGAGLLILAVVLPQSACSFWPFAHMSLIHEMERKKEYKTKTFDLGYSLNILAISLPFSASIIMFTCSYPTLFLSPGIVMIASFVLLALGIAPTLFSRIVFRRIERHPTLSKSNKV